MTVNSQSIVITAAPGAEPSTAERWLRLTTDPPEQDEGASKAQLAGMLDSLIGITDHCKQDSVPAENIDQTIKKNLSSQTSCQSAVERLSASKKCSPARRTGLPMKKNVYAHWSWNEDQPSELYRVVPLGAAVVLSGPVRGSKVINLVIDVTNSNSAPVRYHADEEARVALWRKRPPRWIGNVVKGKRIVAGPEIGWANGKVLLGATVSGRLELWLPIIYDTWEISIHGVWLGDGKRSYKAKVLGVSEQLDQPAEANLEDETEGDPDADDCSSCGGSSDAVPDDQLPDDGTGDDGDDGTGDVTVTVNGEPVYCYLRVDWTLYKSCTGDYVDSGTEYRQVECPKDESITPTYNVGYNSIKELPPHIYEVGREEVERYTDGGEEVITAAEYKDKCCYDAVRPICIPQCMTSKNTYYGTTWPLVEKKLKDEYPGETKIVYVGPRSGVCGTRTDEFEFDNCDVCKDVPKLVWDDDNPDIIAPNSYVDLELTGGNYPELPIAWEITDGSGYSFVPLPEVVVKIIGGLAARLYSGAVPCGTAAIAVTDGCSDAAGEVDPTNKLSWSVVPETIPAGSSRSCSISGGLSTKTYTLSGAPANEVYFANWSQVFTTTVSSVGVYVNADACGVYPVTLTVSDGCTSASTQITIVGKAALAWSVAPETIPAGSNRSYSISGGLTNKTYTLSGAPANEVYFANWSQVFTTTASSVGVYVNADACGVYPVTLTVSDGCTSASTPITIVGKAALAWSVAPETIPAGSNGSYSISGGLTNKTYTLSGAPANEVYFANLSQVFTTTASSVGVYVNYNTNPGTTAILTVSDGCSEAQHTITTT